MSETLEAQFSALPYGNASLIQQRAQEEIFRDEIGAIFIFIFFGHTSIPVIVVNLVYELQSL